MLFTERALAHTWAIGTWCGSVPLLPPTPIPVFLSCSPGCVREQRGGGVASVPKESDDEGFDSTEAVQRVGETGERCEEGGEVRGMGRQTVSQF